MTTTMNRRLDVSRKNAEYPGGSSAPESFDVAVIGGGLAGLTAAVAASAKGMKTALIAPIEASQDSRTSAVLSQNIEQLADLGIWQHAAAKAAPLRIMRIIDGTNRLIRAPQVDFRSSEIGVTEFGFNIQNRYLSEIIEKLIQEDEYLSRFDARLDAIDLENPGLAKLQLSNGKKVCATIVLAADGRGSAVRSALGIESRQWQYPQVALVGNFTHSLPHHDTSTEFHTPTGPLTLVPLGDRRSSLVCVVDPAKAERLKAMSLADLEVELERAMQSVLGKIKLETPLVGFPLSGMMAKRYGASNVGLIGEAAHVFPPIGAQGLNLGLRDVQAAMKLLAKPNALERADRFGDTYHRARLADIASRTASVDLLNRSLLSDFLPVQAVRSLGLQAIGSIGPLRRLFMQEGIDPGRSVSRNAQFFRRNRA